MKAEGDAVRASCATEKQYRTRSPPFATLLRFGVESGMISRDGMASLTDEQAKAYISKLLTAMSHCGRLGSVRLQGLSARA